MITIYQKPSNLIKNLFVILVLTFYFPMGIHAKETKESKAKITYALSSPNNQKINLRLAITRKEHAQGLSGIKPSDFPNDAGMLFVNDSMGMRQFWMPDTYFNLDITYLDSDLKVTAIDRDVPAHPGMTEPPMIFRAKPQKAQFILETKANSDFSKNLKIGDQLKWISPTSLSEIVLKTRQMQ